MENKGKSLGEIYNIKPEENNISIKLLPLSYRARHQLERAGITSFSDLLQCSQVELVSIRFFGNVCLGEVRKFLTQVSTTATIVFRDEDMIKKEIEEHSPNFLFKKIINERLKLIIHRRMSGKTFAAIGQEVQLSRERVIQILNRAACRSAGRMIGTKILKEISQHNAGEKNITTEMLRKYVGNNEELIYLMKLAKVKQYKYDEGIDTFLIGVSGIEHKNINNK